MRDQTPLPLPSHRQAVTTTPNDYGPLSSFPTAQRVRQHVEEVCSYGTTHGPVLGTELCIIISIIVGGKRRFEQQATLPLKVFGERPGTQTNHTANNQHITEGGFAEEWIDEGCSSSTNTVLLLISCPSLGSILYLNSKLS